MCPCFETSRMQKNVKGTNPFILFLNSLFVYVLAIKTTFLIFNLVNFVNSLFSYNCIVFFCLEPQWSWQKLSISSCICLEVQKQMLNKCRHVWESDLLRKEDEVQRGEEALKHNLSMKRLYNERTTFTWSWNVERSWTI